MSLFDKLNSIPKEKWLYYNSPILNENRQENNSGDYEFCQHFKIFFDAFTDPFSFVQNYFGLGGKSGFLPETIFGNKYDIEDKVKYGNRAKHIVSTYFLGLYLFDKIKFLQPRDSSFLGKNENHEFLWAWYLCSLYHDAFYNIENDITDNAELEQLRDCKFNYCKFSNFLLYNEETIKRYYYKNRNKSTSFDGGVHYDHGIIGAEHLYKNYIKGIARAIQQESNIANFFTDEGLYVDGTSLIVNYEHFIAICKIAKIIACHNVYICDKDLVDQNKKKDIDKYKEAKLRNLIPGFYQFAPMPHYHFGRLDEYEKLYFLLALVDNIEPTKKNINLNEIDLCITSEHAQYYIINIFYQYSEEDEKRIKEIEKWLNFVSVKTTEYGISLCIDFSDFV